MEGSHIWVPSLDPTGVGLGGAGQDRLRREHALSEKDPIMRVSSGAQFTKLALNTEPEAPEAHLGKDVNPNMSTLARTEVRTLANNNTTRNISESLTVHSPPSDPCPVPS